MKEDNHMPENNGPQFNFKENYLTQTSQLNSYIAP